MSNLGITARSSSSGLSIGFDSNGGVAYAMHAAPTVSTASGQPMGSLRRSNRQVSCCRDTRQEEVGSSRASMPSLLYKVSVAAQRHQPASGF